MIMSVGKPQACEWLVSWVNEVCALPTNTTKSPLGQEIVLHRQGNNSVIWQYWELYRTLARNGCMLRTTPGVFSERTSVLFYGQTVHRLMRTLDA